MRLDWLRPRTCTVVMILDIIWNGETTPVDLIDGAATVGGGAKDDIKLEGLPVKLLTLEVDGPRLSIKSIRPLRVGNQLFPAHVPRLVMPGEAMTLPNDVVVRRPEDEASKERRKNKSTDFLARELLSGDLSALESRAATLTCVAGANEGHVYPIAFLDTSIGRADDVDIRLHDRSVSRRHARVIHRGLSYFVEDLGTTNAIFVNGQKLKSARQLSTGDVIELGHTMLRFEEGERAPEERTVIQKMPEPPLPTPAPAEPPSNVQVAAELALPAPASTPPMPGLLGGGSTTNKLPQRKRFARADIVIIVLGLMLMLSGLSTAAFFWRG
jgi:hypothetical protein